MFWRNLGININANIHVHDHRAADAGCFQTEVLGALNAIKEGMKAMALELDKLNEAVGKRETVDESVIELLKGLSQMVRDLPADRAQISALADRILASADKSAAAVVEHTPADPNA